MTPTNILRVGKEIDNIGERVAMSKKRISWHFVFTNDQQVHTVTLEHSRLSAKKRLKLDGKKLYQSDTYCTNGWKYHFQLPNEKQKSIVDFCVEIKDVRKIMSMKMTSSSSTITSSDHQQQYLDHDAVYELSVNGIPWCELGERKFSFGQPSHTSNMSTSTSTSINTSITNSIKPNVWSSEMYPRKIEKASNYDQMQRKKIISWIFTFGLHGAIHRLDLQITEQEEEFVVVLDGRILTRIFKSSLCQEKVWHFQTNELTQHQVEILLPLLTTTKEQEQEEPEPAEFFIDGFTWHEMSETDFVLLPGWYPVFSRTRGTNYYRNDTLALTQWEKPIIQRGESLSPKDSPPLLYQQPEEEPSHTDTASISPVKEAILLDFSMWDQSNTSAAIPVQQAYSSFDPFAPVPQHQQHQQQEEDELKPKDFFI